MIRKMAVLVVLVVALAVPAGASAHRNPCHAAKECPSDHHTYAWNGLVCTSYKAERLPKDKVVRVVQGRRYWCHRGKG